MSNPESGGFPSTKDVVTVTDPHGVEHSFPKSGIEKLPPDPLLQEGPKDTPRHVPIIDGPILRKKVDY